MTSPAPSTVRCAAHPARLAVDGCPVCARPRCGADVSSPLAAGCAVCRGSETGIPVATLQRRPADDLERTVRASLAGYAVAIGWGLVTAEYVGAELFRYLSPAVLGILSGAATQQAGPSTGSGATGLRVRLVAVVFALLGVAFGFVREDTTRGLTLHLDQLVAYLIAGTAAWVWTLPPRARKAAVSG